MIMDGQGDLLPVSRHAGGRPLPLRHDPYEKRDIAMEMPIWDPDICIHCGKCAIVCPHATIRMKVFRPQG